MQRQDTIKAEENLSKSLELNPYDADAWSVRGALRLARRKYKEGEADFDQAIHLNSKNANNYIDRALCRYHQDNYRGAMEDYDIALDIDPKNFLGHYNRGMLRAYVGDDNRAIEDFNFVLQIEPDNMFALFNRARLLDATGDYHAAIRDYSKVLKEYPNFWEGYHMRAQARKKVGDTKGAAADEFKLVKYNFNMMYGGNNVRVKTKTRKKSSRNLNEYEQLVEDDNDETIQHYASAYRGRVQENTANSSFLPMFVLTFYPKKSEVHNSIYYNSVVDALNALYILPEKMYISGDEANMTEEQIALHQEDVDAQTRAIQKDGGSAMRYFARAADYAQLMDFESAMADADSCIARDNRNLLGYFMRAVVRFKKMKSAAPEQAKEQSAIAQLEYKLILKDLDEAIRISPTFAYTYYNRGNVLAEMQNYPAAIADYDHAIALDRNLAEAYYNRGLVYIKTNHIEKGVADLSKAGEMGLYSAYSLIKKYNIEMKKKQN